MVANWQGDLVEHLGESVAGDERRPRGRSGGGGRCEGAIASIEEVAARLAHPGYALLIDYGGVGEPGGHLTGIGSTGR